MLSVKHFGIKIFLILTHISVLFSSYQNQCPFHSQWQYRAKAFCNVSDKYFCLYDENNGIHLEFCRRKPEFEAAGFKYIVVGTLQGHPCGPEKFQPFKFWTNISTDCIFKKSSCSGEGQILYKNGDSRSDRLCRCDHTKGYAFLMRPEHPCYCRPFYEDCSCLQKQCNIGQILTPDYKCVGTTEWTSSFLCNVVTESSGSGDDLQVQLVNGLYNQIKDDELIRSKTSVLVVIGLAITISGLFAFCLLQDVFPFNENYTEEVHVIGDHVNKYKYEWKSKMARFVETKAAKVILETTKKTNCVLITGPMGCGKTAIAYYVALNLENEKKYSIISVPHTAAIDMFATTDKRIFILDDVFGKHSSCCDYTERAITIRKLLKDNKNVKILMTCRSYIYSLLDAENKDTFFVHCNLISTELQLTLLERKAIAQQYLNERWIGRDFEGCELMLYNFFPALCSYYSGNENCSKVDLKYPLAYLTEEMQVIHQHREPIYVGLALSVIFNGTIDKSTLEVSNQNSIQVLNDIFTESGCLENPSKRSLYSSLVAMEGTFLTENETTFSFLNEYLFEMISSIMGALFLRSILKHGKRAFILTRLQLKTLSQSSDKFTILVNENMENEYFNRLIMDIKLKNIAEVLESKFFQFSNFRKKCIHHFRKHLKAKDLVDISDNSTVLHKIAYKGYSDLLAYFIKEDKPNINKRDSKGRTALFLSCVAGHQPIAELLLHAKADVSQTDTTGRSPLHVACETGKVHLVELLLRYNADIKKVDKCKLTPLHLACVSGNLQTVIVLIQKGADINKCDKKGRSPLYISCENKHDKIVKYLLQISKKQQLKVNTSAQNGLTPFQVADQSGFETIVRLFQTYNSDKQKRNNRI